MDAGGDLHALIAQLRDAARRGERVRVSVGERTFAVPGEAAAVIAHTLGEYTRTVDEPAVSVAQAALIMGVSREEAIRRLRANDIRAVERAGRLLVARASLPEPAPMQRTHPWDESREIAD